MGKRIHRTLVASIAFILLLAGRVDAGIDVINLGSLGGDYSFANGLNNEGEVVGFSNRKDGSFHGFYYKNGQMHDVDPNSRVDTDAVAVNDNGWIVGGIRNLPTGAVGQIYSQPCLFLAGLGGIKLSTAQGSALGINDRNEIVGFKGAQLTGLPYVDVFGSFTEIAKKAGTGQASAINNSGEIIITDFEPTNRAFLYVKGVLHDLGTLGGDRTQAEAINSQGDIVGESTTADGIWHPFLYSHGQMIDLGAPDDAMSPSDPAFNSSAFGINDHDQIVGVYIGGDGQNHPFMYTNGTMLDLNDLANLTTLDFSNGFPPEPPGFLSLTEATGINNSGQVIGFGEYWDGTTIVSRAFLLNLNEKVKR